MTRAQDDGTDNVISLPVDPPSAPALPPPSPPRGFHALAISGMALFALAGVASLLAFVTVNWPQNLSRLLIKVFAISVGAFMVCAAIAVFSAVREPYVEEDPPE